MNQQQAALIVSLNMVDEDIAVMFPDVATRHYGIVREWGGRGGDIQIYEDAKWESCEYPNFGRSWDYRLAPRTVTLSGPGGTFELPEPMRVAPEVGEIFWVIDATAEPPEALMTWNGLSWDQRALARGLCHATKEAAQQWADALSKVMGVQQ